jgi:hypothetical protein
LNILEEITMDSKFVNVTKLFATLALCLFVFGSMSEARNCKKGKPCGNSCISKNDVCHKDETSSKAAAAPMATEPAKSEPVKSEPAASEPKAKHCAKGKPCGNSCIAADAVCHQ